MSKERKGCVVERAGKLYVRVAYTDQLGQRRKLMRRARNKKHARELRKELVKQLASVEPGNQRAELDAQKLTFAKVAAAFEAARLIPAEYVGDRKIRRPSSKFRSIGVQGIPHRRPTEQRRLVGRFCAKSRSVRQEKRG